MTAKAKPGGGSEWADLDGEQMLEVDSVCSRVAKAWKQGQGPQIEACLSGANPQLRSVLFKELLLLECSCRRKRGESPEQHDYTARFPEYQDLIAQVFTAEGQNPSVIGGYEIREEVGKGSFGVVYRAYDRGLGRHVAIKLIQPDRRNQDDLLRAQTWEGRLQAKLIHENIVRIHGTGVDPQHGPFIVFEYVDGKSLREELRGRDGGRFSVPEAIRIAAGIADAISHAHACSVIHRDLKPANILIDRAGTPFVTDFGLAIHDFSRRSSEGQVAGTEAYMAPEQRHGKPDAASDV